MHYYAVRFLVIIFETACGILFIRTFGIERHQRWLRFLQSLLFVTCAYIPLGIFVNSVIIREMIAVIVFSLYVYRYIRIGLMKAFVLSFFYMALILLGDGITYLIDTRFLMGEMLLSGKSTEMELLFILLGKGILLLEVLIIRRIFGRQRGETMSDLEWIKFLFFPCFTVTAIIGICSAFKDVENQDQYRVLLLIVTGLIGMNIFVFYLLQDIIKRGEEVNENKIFRMQAKKEVALYRNISENFDIQRRKVHEYKNQIVCIESLLAKKQFCELEEYVKGIYGELRKDTDAINTNHTIVNAVLNAKYEEALEKGIVFVIKVNDLSNLKMEDEDTVTILSNLLNNAIEACELCQVKKIIRIKFVIENNLAIIAVSNTYRHPLQYENGELQSTKMVHQEEHGMGIKNVVRALKKYGGSHVIHTSDQEFMFSIIIPN